MHTSTTAIPPLRIVQYGLGPIGLETARAVRKAGGRLRLVGAIDTDPAKAGRSVGELLGEAPDALIVSADAPRLLAEARPNVALHTTSSFLPRVMDQLLACAEAGVHVVSSTEELFYPYARHPELAAALDAAARKAGVVLTGTGVNPGFVMDVLALAATGVCTEVRAVHAERVVDAGLRREPLQRKVGAGLSPEAFAAKKAAGGFGHIGLVESLRFLAAGLGLPLARVEETLEPVLSPRPAETPFLRLGAGDVAGIHHRAAGYDAAGAAVATLDLRMFVGAEAPYDAVTVEGAPPVRLRIEGGVFGDTATVAMLINMIPSVVSAAPGLRCAYDLAPPRAWAAAPR